MQTLELKIPPLFLVVVAAVLMWIGAYSFPQLSFLFTHQPLVACGFALCGAFTCAIGIMEFNRAKTTVNPMKPQSASSLVRTGIYRRTRNPMYLGFLSLLLASAILTGNVAAFFVLPGFVIYMNRFQINLKSELWRDAVIWGNVVLLRAERAGRGNGRVYHVHFTAADLEGSSSGIVIVTVPANKKTDAVTDGGELYISTQ